MNCFNCAESLAKYKCVKCYSKICSAKCMKAHRESDKCQNEPEKPAPDTSSEKYHTEDTIKPQLLIRLNDSPEIQEVLKDDDLRHILKQLDCSPDPSTAVAEALKLPKFQKFADLCLRAVGEDTADT